MCGILICRGQVPRQGEGETTRSRSARVVGFRAFERIEPGGGGKPLIAEPIPVPRTVASASTEGGRGSPCIVEFDDLGPSVEGAALNGNADLTVDYLASQEASDPSQVRLVAGWHGPS
jgi:hypothetical protein